VAGVIEPLHRREQLSNVENTQRYFPTVNEIFGVLSFGIALACISTDNPQLYGCLAVVFVFLVWLSNFIKFRSEFVELKNTSVLSASNVLKKSFIALIGWSFLGAVAIGLFDSSGWAL
jgi:hypothetical protein